MNILSHLATTSFFYMPVCIQYITTKFPKECDARTQNIIVPAWRLEVRKRFEQIVDKNAFYRHFFTISLPENFLIALRFIMGVKNTCMPGPPTPFVIGYLTCTLLVTASGVNILRKVIFYSMIKSNIPTKYIFYIAPRDCINWKEANFGEVFNNTRERIQQFVASFFL